MSIVGRFEKVDTQCRFESCKLHKLVEGFSSFVMFYFVLFYFVFVL